MLSGHTPQANPRWPIRSGSAALLLALSSPLLAGEPDSMIFRSNFERLLFTDISSTLDGFALAQPCTESLAWGDYDNDGDEDLYLSVDGPNKLYRNNGDGSFTDVTAEAGVTGGDRWSVGTAFGDLDNDGDLDLYIVNFNRGADLLFRNDGPTGEAGAYVFTEIGATAGIDTGNETFSSRGMTYIDFDRDGLLDIYVNTTAYDLLYHNRGDLQFVNVAMSKWTQNNHLGVGVVSTDVDNNGWLDLFTGNRSFDPNRLFLNDGGEFTEITQTAPIDKFGLGMGVIAFDYDNDLDIDLYWTAWPRDGRGLETIPNAFYENQGAGTNYVDVAALTETEDLLGYGISANAGDIDNDGFEDFIVTNGSCSNRVQNAFFRNLGDGSFENLNAGAKPLLGVPLAQNPDCPVADPDGPDGRGVAFADYDHDGDLDVIITGGPGAPNHIWRNDSDPINRWLTLKLTGSTSNRSAIGARVEVQTNLRTTVKEVSGGAGRGSFNSLPLEFGLGPATSITEVRIRWPSGVMQTLSGVGMDQILAVSEPPAE